MKVILNNKKAYHNYKIESTIEAGIVLIGNEVKSIKNGDCSLTQSSFVEIDNKGEVYLNGFTVNEYVNTNTYTKTDTQRKKKLLLNKSEINRLRLSNEAKGFTIIATKVYVTRNNLIKIELGLAKGLNKSDKRESQKKKDFKREVRKYIA